MPQAKYEQLLLDRTHSKRLWENEPAEDVTFRDLDRAQIARVVDAARTAGRLSSMESGGISNVLDRLGVRRNGKILNAAIVLFGKKFLPDYPQCELRLARFRGVNKTEFMDQKMLRGPALQLLEEAQVFCMRHFPLPGRIVPEHLERQDRPLIPPDAMREILVNAIIHRDYTIAGGAISLAIFDDCVEVWSAGTYPKGITAASLTREHQSVQRNPIIAEVFHRMGLIEKWGRGTNRVMEMCLATGIAPPVFTELTGAAVVTFKVPVSTTPQVTGEVKRLLAVITGEMKRDEIQMVLGLPGGHFKFPQLWPPRANQWIRQILFSALLKTNVLSREQLKKTFSKFDPNCDESKVGYYLSLVSNQLKMKKNDFLRQVISYDYPRHTWEKDNFTLRSEYRDLVEEVLGALKEKPRL